MFVLQEHLDHRHMGLGGDDSWSPCVPEQYLLPPMRYAFSLRLCPMLLTSSCHDITGLSSPADGAVPETREERGPSSLAKQQ
jgi:hypothetical protein